MNYTSFASSDTQSISRTFFSKVFGLMASGLACTALIAFLVTHNVQILYYIMSTPLLVYGLIGLQIVVVLALSYALRSLSTPIALSLFYLYAGLLGISLSSVVVLYTSSSIATSFIVCSGMFSIMAIYGYWTQADLSSLGNLSCMGVLGISLALAVNLYFQNTFADTVISFVGVGLFLALTAYDMQKLKQLAYSSNYASSDRAVIVAALTLYLDFINLFLMILRFMGKKRD